MRLSVLTFLLLFLAFSIYLGWENGAFQFSRIPMPVQGDTQKTQSAHPTNEALKSESQALMKKPVSSPSLVSEERE